MTIYLSMLDVSKSDFLEKAQDRMTLYNSNDKIRACLNDKNKETQLNLENNETISNNGNYGSLIYIKWYFLETKVISYFLGIKWIFNYFEIFIIYKIITIFVYLLSA